MKQYYITIVLILISVLGFGQSKILTKEEIRKYFKKTGGLSSRQWHTCNTDSIFYKSDTLNLYEYAAPDCKEYVMWNFEKPTEFYIHRGWYEGAVGATTVATENDHYKMEIIQDEELWYLKVIQKRKIIYLFRILEIGYSKDERQNKITLVRISNKD